MKIMNEAFFSKQSHKHDKHCPSTTKSSVKCLIQKIRFWWNASPYSYMDQIWAALHSSFVKTIRSRNVWSLGTYGSGSLKCSRSRNLLSQIERKKTCSAPNSRPMTPHCHPCATWSGSPVALFSISLGQRWRFDWIKAGWTRNCPAVSTDQWQIKKKGICLI